MGAVGSGRRKCVDTACENERPPKDSHLNVKHTSLYQPGPSNVGTSDHCEFNIRPDCNSATERSCRVTAKFQLPFLHHLSEPNEPALQDILIHQFPLF